MQQTPGYSCLRCVLFGPGASNATHTIYILVKPNRFGQSNSDLPAVRPAGGQSGQQKKKKEQQEKEAQAPIQQIRRLLLEKVAEWHIEENRQKAAKETERAAKEKEEADQQKQTVRHERALQQHSIKHNLSHTILVFHLHRGVL
jgi:hypothetical protein